jgi:TonB family protein
MVFTYHVLKDSQVKEGAAEIQYKGKLGFREKGQFSQGYRFGIWEFFDSDNTIIQKYNYTTQKFEYLQNFNSVKAVYILIDQELVKIETGSIPVLLGGDAKFLYFLANNMIYPHAARSRGASGTVGVMVTINKEGEMLRPFIPKPGDKALDAEALRVVSLMPNDWIPLYINGEATDSLVLFHINFQLG